jgi:glycosyltransferase involved in cell wall biosynthesis
MSSMSATAGRLCYILDAYVSHQRAARPYIAILRQWHDVGAVMPAEDAIVAYAAGGTPTTLLGDAAETADVIIVHAELASAGWRRLLHDLRRPGRRLVTYSVWEADALPPVYVEALGYCDQVWTPSRFCLETYQQAFPDSMLIPHVVDLPPAPPQKSEDTLELLIFLKEGDRRKNSLQAISALNTVLADWPESWPPLLVHYVTRDSPNNEDYMRHAADVRRWGGDVHFWFRPSDDEIESLYRRAQVLVSLHHGEAWGLTLSEAMAQGVLVVASNWSGNLDYMSPANSFLVNGEVELIRDSDRTSLFQPPMRWFYPDLADAARQIRNACQVWVENAQGPYVEAARRALASFTAQAVAPLLHERLSTLGLAAATTVQRLRT